jgi:hypothetical protein
VNLTSRAIASRALRFLPAAACMTVHVLVVINTLQLVIVRSVIFKVECNSRFRFIHRLFRFTSGCFESNFFFPSYCCITGSIIPRMHV